MAPPGKTRSTLLGRSRPGGRAEIGTLSRPPDRKCSEQESGRCMESPAPRQKSAAPGLVSESRVPTHADKVPLFLSYRGGCLLPCWANRPPAAPAPVTCGSRELGGKFSPAPPGRPREALLNLRAPRSGFTGEGRKGYCCPSGTWCSEAINHAGDSRVMGRRPWRVICALLNGHNDEAVAV